MIHLIRKYSAAIFIVLVAGSAVFSAAFPIVTKGEPSWQDYLSLIQARNKALAGTYQYESADGVYLSSDHARTNGVETSIPNTLTPIIYGKLFQWFGFNQQLPVYFGIALFAASAVLVAVLGMRLFGNAIGLVAGASFSMTPIAVSAASMGGFYEWGLFFFLSALYLYLGSRKGPFTAPMWRIILSGVLFACAALARNAFAVSLIPIAAYEFYATRSYKRIAALTVPIVLIFGSTLTPYSWLGVSNGYLGNQHQPFQQVGHFFRDPYSAVYDREQAIKEAYAAPGGLDRISAKFARQWGFNVTLLSMVKAYRDSAIFYVTEAVPPWEFGGPLLLVLACGGYLVLRKRHKEFAAFTIVWIAFWFAYLVYDQSANSDHYLEILFLMSASVAFGIVWMYETMKSRGVRPAIIGALLAVSVAGTLAYGAKWRFSQQYNNPAYTNGVLALQAVDAFQGTGVIAMGIHNEVAYAIAYKTNRDIVLFNPDTIAELAKSGTLKEVFKRYGVTLAVGFDSSYAAAAGVPVIAIP